MGTECDIASTADPDWLRGEWHRVTRRAGWPSRVEWHSAAVELCIESFVTTGHVRSACMALGRDRAAAEIPLDVALCELDALFLCALALPADGAVVQAYVSARVRATAPGTLPPGTDPLTELPSAALLQQRLKARTGAGERTRLLVVQLEIPETRYWHHVRHLLLTARHMERALGEDVYAVPAGRLMALVDGDDPALPDRLDRLCRAPVDPLGGTQGVPGPVPSVPRPHVRLAIEPGMPQGS